MIAYMLKNTPMLVIVGIGVIVAAGIGLLSSRQAADERSAAQVEAADTGAETDASSANADANTDTSSADASADRQDAAIEVATSSEFMTVRALQQAVIPEHDPTDVAIRLGLLEGELEPPPENPPPLAVGARETFWVSNSETDEDFQIEATLQVVGEHIYLWVQDGQTVPQEQLEALAQGFDTRVYQQVRDLWGEEPSPGIDGDPRIHGLFSRGLGSFIGAYYAGRHVLPSAVLPRSNEREMFFFNIDNVAGAPTFILEGIMAHEFQHMIRDNIQGNQETWLDEGFSDFTQLILGYDRQGSSIAFLAKPDTQLNSWTEEGSRAPDYGGSLMFLTYLHDRFGLEAVQAISNHDLLGMQAVDAVVREFGNTDANTVFADWLIANFILDPDVGDGLYGYQSLDQGLPSAIPTDEISTYPFNQLETVNQYAADYYVVSNLGDAEMLDIRIDMPEMTQLIPTDAFSGDFMWYSNRGDGSDMRLTRAFDLTDVESATLHYQAWYRIENLWDYAYVMVSADDGATWEILEAPHTTTDNPHGNAYGPGYSGQSETWLAESISLDDYAGQEILVRFELISDDAVNQPGIAIDDVAIPEIDYFNDFESTDDDGWQAEGWVRIDNVLPQQAWVQAVQLANGDVLPTRWLAPNETAWTLPLADHVSQVILIVSPFAPVTTVPMDYALSVDAQ
ncbi:MAG: hypothetical protein D6737_18960 [Chloroflexi bacterium]|nr:MAG: hypothetical protein D6737_18960 [Chloroflexota bacterium]